MMENGDKDGDGTISAEELSSIDATFRDRISAADSDGDGAVTRDEIMTMIRQRAGG